MIIDIVRLASKNRMTLTSQIRKMMDLEVGDVLAFVDFEDHVGMWKGSGHRIPSILRKRDL